MRLWCYLIDLEESSVLVVGGGSQRAVIIFSPWFGAPPQYNR